MSAEIEFRELMDTATQRYLKGAFRDCPDAEPFRGLLEICVRDAFSAGFEIGFSVARELPENILPTPPLPLAKVKETNPQRT